MPALALELACQECTPIPMRHVARLGAWAALPIRLRQDPMIIGRYQNPIRLGPALGPNGNGSCAGPNGNWSSTGPNGNGSSAGSNGNESCLMTQFA
jgi:hypothetical protein